MYFELAIEYYPKSANAYDSMADYYETQNDIANAISFMQKAAELNDAEYYKNRIQELKNR
jgi:tetratricopeptide (TPR) repeat protein